MVCYIGNGTRKGAKRWGLLRPGFTTIVVNLTSRVLLPLPLAHYRSQHLHVTVGGTNGYCVLSSIMNCSTIPLPCLCVNLPVCRRKAVTGYRLLWSRDVSAWAGSTADEGCRQQANTDSGAKQAKVDPCSVGLFTACQRTLYPLLS